MISWIKRPLLQNKAFSMIELSIFILLLSLIMVAIITVKSADRDSKAKLVTNQRIEKINQALEVYATKNKSLPCPADLSIVKSSNATYGNSALSPSSGKCCTSISDSGCSGQTNFASESGSGTSIYYGAVPFKALDLTSEMAEDGFGSKIIYIVKGQFVTTGVSYFNSQTITGTQIQVNGANSDAMFLLISGGKNKRGVFNSNSSSSNTAGVSDEVENTNATANANFIATSTNSAFDDIVYYKSRDQFLSDTNEVINTKKCLGSSASVVTTYGPITWPDADPGQIAVATSLCPSTCTGGPSIRWNAGVYAPTRKCLSDGTWESTVTTACTSTSCAPCSATSETLYGVTINWPSTTAGSIGTATTPCPTACNGGSSWNGGAAYPQKTCNADGTWGSMQATCTSQPCCSIPSNYNTSNATYSGPATILYNNQTLSMSSCNSGYGRRLKSAGSGSGTVGGTSCGRVQSGSGDRINSESYLTCSGTTTGSLTMTDTCSACRTCSTSSLSGHAYSATDQCSGLKNIGFSSFGFPSTMSSETTQGICRYSFNRYAGCGGGIGFCQFLKVYLIIGCFDGNLSESPNNQTDHQDCMTPPTTSLYSLGNDTPCQQRPSGQYVP